MKAGEIECDEASVLARLDDGFGASWDVLLGAVGRALARWPAYRRMEPAELRASVNGLAMLFRGAIAGRRLGRDERTRLATVFSERLLLGLAPEQLRAAVHAAAAAGYHHLWSVVAGTDLDRPSTLPAVHRAVVRLWDMADDLQEIVIAAAGDAGASRGRRNTDAEHHEGELAALQRRTFAHLALQQDTQWGVLGVVAGRYRAVDLAEAADAAATATGGACGSLRSEPVGHVMVLVPFAARQTATAWDTTVATAIKALWWQGAAVLATRPVCATDITASERWLRNSLTYAGILPGATGVAGARVEIYSDAEAVPPPERLRRFRTNLGPLLADRDGPRLLRTLDALAAFDNDPRVAAAYLETSELAIDRHLAAINATTGFDWSDPAGRDVLLRVVVYRWLAAAFDAPYDAAWGPVPALRDLATPP